MSSGASPLLCVVVLLSVSLSSCLPSTTVRRVLMGVKQRGIATIESTLHALSDPASPQYGQYLTLSELDAITANPEGTSAAIAWLASHGFRDVTPTNNGLYLHATFPAGSAPLQDSLLTDTTLREHVDAVVAWDPHGEGGGGHVPGPMMVRSSPPQQLYPGGNTTIKLVNRIYNVDSNNADHQGATQA